MNVHVVLAECGEGDERDVWVAGVYTDEQTAKSEVERHTAMRKALLDWYNNPSGEQPEFEPADRYEIIEVEMDTWT